MHITCPECLTCRLFACSFPECFPVSPGAVLSIQRAKKESTARSKITRVNNYNEQWRIETRANRATRA